MNTTDLVNEAKRLPPAEQVELVEAILDNLDVPDAALDAAWTREAEDRLAAYRRGEIRAVPLTEVLAKYQPR
ncbi:MAG TPA: addiction module protein [Defluviicoccus sp.]|nr:addiction module protein [Defluviicoccus sp.]